MKAKFRQQGIDGESTFNRLLGPPGGDRSEPSPCEGKMGIHDAFIHVNVRVFSRHRLIYEFKRGAIHEGREFELVASGVTNDFALGGELSQDRANGGGANATEFLQLLNWDRFLELSQSLAHALYGRGWSVRLNVGPFDHRQGHGRARFGEDWESLRE